MPKDPLERLKEYAKERDAGNGTLSMLVDEIEQRYMKLPLDADGVPIKPGQTLYDGNREIPGEYVYGISDEFVYIWNYGGIVGITGEFPKKFTHHNPDTVEDLLREFAIECVDPKYHNTREFNELRETYARRIKAVHEGLSREELTSDSFDIKEYMLSRGDTRKYYFVLPHIPASDFKHDIHEKNYPLRFGFHGGWGFNDKEALAAYQKHAIGYCDVRENLAYFEKFEKMRGAKVAIMFEDEAGKFWFHFDYLFTCVIDADELVEAELLYND